MESFSTFILFFDLLLLYSCKFFSSSMHAVRAWVLLSKCMNSTEHVTLSYYYSLWVVLMVWVFGNFQVRSSSEFCPLVIIFIFYFTLHFLHFLSCSLSGYFIICIIITMAVTLSTIEAKYIATFEVVKEAIWL